MNLKTERDARVTQLYEQLIEIEQRLIPAGLHVFGRGAELREKNDLLRMVASFDRPELGARSLPGLIAEGLGVDGYDEMIQQSTTGETKDLIDEICKEAIERFCDDGQDAASGWLSARANVEIDKSRPTLASGGARTRVTTGRARRRATDTAVLTAPVPQRSATEFGPREPSDLTLKPLQSSEFGRLPGADTGTYRNADRPNSAGFSLTVPTTGAFNTPQPLPPVRTNED